MLAEKDSKMHGNSTLGCLGLVLFVAVLIMLVVKGPQYIDKLLQDEKARIIHDISRTYPTGRYIPTDSTHPYEQHFRLYYALNEQGKPEPRIDTSSIDPLYIEALVDVYYSKPYVYSGAPEFPESLSKDEIMGILKTLDPNCEEYKTASSQDKKEAIEKLDVIYDWYLCELKCEYCSVETGEKVVAYEKSDSVGTESVGCRNLVMQRYLGFKYGYVAKEPDFLNSKQGD